MLIWYPIEQNQINQSQGERKSGGGGKSARWPAYPVARWPLAG